MAYKVTVGDPNTIAVRGRLRAAAAVGLLALLAGGCANLTEHPQERSPRLPDAWQRGAAPGVFGDLGIADFNMPVLKAWVAEALADNRELARQRARMESARQAVIRSRADRLPWLSLGLGAERARPTPGAAIGERYDASLTLGMEVDLWGRLSAAQREAELRLRAEEAGYAQLRRQVAADVATSAFEALAAQRLLALFKQRLASLQASLEVIESRYRRGLNEALDVYLAQTTVEQERANIANQNQLAAEAAARLQLLLANYPDGKLALDAPKTPDRETSSALPPALAPSEGLDAPGTQASETTENRNGNLETDAALPVIKAPIPAGLPAQLLTRRADLQLAWLQLLAADAALAAAHRSRFPSLNLAASLRDASTHLDDILAQGELAWSLGGSLVQPLFQGGRLRALEAQARQKVVELEQSYLQAVFRALAEVENELSRLDALQNRHSAHQQAQVNAEAALDIANDQYLRGLVDYTTVLAAQRRAFDAQTSVIQLRARLLQSRVALQLALGGNLAQE